MSPHRPFRGVLPTAAAWLSCWVLTYAAGLWSPNAGWLSAGLPLAGAAATAAAAAGSRRPWRTWLLGAVWGNLGISLLIAARVPQLLVNLRFPGYGRLTAGGGFAILVTTWTVRVLMAAVSPPLLLLFRRRDV